MKCIVDGALLYKQLKGMFALSGVQADGNFIVKAESNSKILVLTACLCSPDICCVKQSCGEKLAVYQLKEPSVFEQYYLNCQAEFMYAEKATKPIYFIVNKNVLKKFEKLREVNITIMDIREQKKVRFMYNELTFELDLVNVEYKKGTKDKEPLNIQGKKGLWRPEYSMDLKCSQFVSLFDDYISSNITWSMLKVISGSVYISNNYAYVLRSAYGFCFKTEKFRPIVSFIESVFYTHIDEATKQMLYRIPCYVLVRLKELCKPDSPIRFTLTPMGDFNISFVANNCEQYVWSWKYDYDENVARILSTYNLKCGGTTNYMLQGTLTEISSGTLRNIARLGLKPNKQMDYGTVVYLGKDNVIHVRPSVTAKSDTFSVNYVEGAQLENVYNFPKVALNTVFLQQVIRVLAGDRKAVTLKMGKINVDIGAFGAMYLQTKDEKITAVILPLLFRE